jgi:hypothetical protein
MMPERTMTKSGQVSVRTLVQSHVTVSSIPENSANPSTPMLTGLLVPAASCRFEKADRFWSALMPPAPRQFPRHTQPFIIIVDKALHCLEPKWIALTGGKLSSNDFEQTRPSN